ncbi:unnamed protein product [Psylliodes chrysocephalus]|uniref:DUF4806 domain-containing protein n=1 Tax=Psylliodes chrysocephalus TaxID=3402493 RepID=A0A9P0DBG3_9CUCU|nr:unnamed protein product [Psylliodes chrysocephala]
MECLEIKKEDPEDELQENYALIDYNIDIAKIKEEINETPSIGLHTSVDDIDSKEMLDIPIPVKVEITESNVMKFEVKEPDIDSKEEMEIKDELPGCSTETEEPSGHNTKGVESLCMQKVPECCNFTIEKEIVINAISTKKNKKRAATSKKADSQLTDRNDLFDNLENQPPATTYHNKINIVSQQVIKQSPFMTNIEMFLTNNVSNVPDYKTILVENDGMMQMIDTLQECPSMSRQLPPEPVIINVGNEIQLLREEIICVKYEISTIKEELSTMKEEIKKDYNKINLNLDKIHKTLSDINFIPKALDPPVSEIPKALDPPITFLSKIGGTTREEDGTKVAYKVIDYLFNPSVLINYTWTGVARGKNRNSRKPFQILEAILDVFFQVISLADIRHTKQKNCNIFKEGVLKYATKRSLRKRSQTDSNVKSSVPHDHANKNKEDVHDQVDTKASNSPEELDVTDGEEDK